MQKDVHVFKIIENAGININDLASVRDKNEAKEILLGKIPHDFHSIIEKWLDKSPEEQNYFLTIKKRFEESRRPENLLAETERNKLLLKHYNKILRRIRLFSKDTDIISMPLFLFENQETFELYLRKNLNVFEKWLKILR